MRRKLFIIVFLSVLAARIGLFASEMRPDTRWFSDAGFGIFLHWGAYSQAAGRWKGQERTRDLWGEWLWNRAGIGREDYESFARTFNPARFDAAEWAATFKDSGARYVILTAKHHEGFAMFRSKASPFNSYDWPVNYHGEPVRELGDAVRQAGMKFGEYSSQQIDWRHCAKPADFGSYFRSVCLPQVTELLTGYGSMAVMWFDIGISDKTMSQELKDLVRKLQPGALISSRIGSCGGDYACGGDNEVPTLPEPPPWESCMTLNYHWATYPQDVYQRSASEVIRLLAEIRSKGGNMLMDVGPDSEGRLAPRDVAVLRRVGQWLQIFGDSIYGVRATPLARVAWGYVTAGKDGLLYLHVFDLPPGGVILLPGIKGAVESCWLHGDPARTPLEVRRDGAEDFKVMVDAAKAPAQALNADDMVIAVKLAPGAQFDLTYRLDDDANNVFTPSLARLNGAVTRSHDRVVYTDVDDPAIEKVRYDDICRLPSDGAMEWTCRSVGPADYHLVVDYSNPSGVKGEMALTVDSREFTAPLEATSKEKSQRFTRIRLGPVLIRKDGQHVVKLVRRGGAGTILVNNLTLAPSRTTLLEDEYAQ